MPINTKIAAFKVKVELSWLWNNFESEITYQAKTQTEEAKHTTLCFSYGYQMVEFRMTRM